MDVQEYRKFLSKLFPSKYINNKIKAGKKLKTALDSSSKKGVNKDSEEEEEDINSDDSEDINSEEEDATSEDIEDTEEEEEEDDEDTEDEEDEDWETDEDVKSKVKHQVVTRSQAKRNLDCKTAGDNNKKVDKKKNTLKDVIE